MDFCQKKVIGILVTGFKNTGNHVKTFQYWFFLLYETDGHLKRKHSAFHIGVQTLLP